MEIAIVGIASRLPGCSDHQAFWNRLLAGEECLTEFGRNEMLTDGVPARLLSDPHYVPVAGFLDGAEFFDAGFFQMSPKEARRTDPQQRLLLGCAYHALGDAGYAPATAPGAVSVFAGTGANGHFWRDLEHADGDPSEQFQAYVANDKDFAATRIAFKLGLNGAAITVQTACSTALVATHLACQSLLLGESDLALAGACSLRLPRKAGYLYEHGGIESPDGHCRPFDSAAAGTVFGDGAAMLALRRLDDALMDGDRIYAIIKGSAVNNDGSDKAGFTAPSEAGQIGVISEALAVAECGPEDISFIEAHGTGTALGDAVEVGALAAVFGGSTRSAPCPMTSVKANIGHTDTVAGAAGLIKAALALKHGILPPQANFTTANPELGLDDRGFVVNSSTTQLIGRRVAGVSAFGIGGSNVHMVLEAPPERSRLPRKATAKLFTIAAAADVALDQRISALQRTVAEDRPDLDDLAFTLRRTDTALPVRAFEVVAADGAPFADGTRIQRIASIEAKRRNVFLFPGQGAQYPDMGRGLYEAFAPYRATIDSAAEILRPLLDGDLRDLLFESSEEDVAQTGLTQPLVFATDMACARLLGSFGLAPEMVIGHSLGEYAAACCAGVFGFEDGLRLVARRGALMQALPTGLMLAVAASPDAIEPYLSGGVGLAGLNAPDSTVVSGPTDEIKALRSRLDRLGVVCQVLATSHAFHSTMMDPMLDAFRSELERITLRPPRIPLVSNLTGGLITDGEATSPEYWCRHLSEPVQFVKGLQTLLSSADQVLIETGPGQVLSALARRHPEASDGIQTLSLMRQPYDERDDTEVFLEALGRIWSLGAKVDWSQFDPPGTSQVTDTPPYPFARDRHWLEPAAAKTPNKPDLELPEFLIPSWRRQTSPGLGLGALLGTWVVEDDGSGLVDTLGQAVQALGAVVITRRSAEIGNPLTAEITGILLTKCDDILPRLAAVARAIEARENASPITVGWLATGLFDVTGTEALTPEAAIGLGALRCLPLEQPCVACLIADADDRPEASTLFAADLANARRDAVLAYRTGRRWHPTTEPLPKSADHKALTGPVLITGGSGGVGRLAAEAVAEISTDPAIDIYLMSRSGSRAPLAPLGKAHLHEIIGDAGDEATVSNAVRDIVARHGRLGGVVHAAGSVARAGFEPLSGRPDNALAVHRRAKIDGVKALEKALDGLNLDLCLLVSSLSTRLGGIGYGAYAGANAVLDATAELQARKGRPWLSADLDGFDLNLDTASLTELNRETGTRVFRQLLHALLGGVTGSVIVSATPFHPREDRWRTAALHGLPSGAPLPEAGVPKPGTSEPGAPDADPLTRAWCDVLGLDDVLDSSNFFELGGSSLSALQLLGQLRRTTGVEISLNDFLADPTLKGLRAAAGATQAAADADLQIADRSKPIPILPGQRRIWVAEQMASERSNFVVNAAYRMTGPLDREALASALSALAVRHEPLRTRIVTIDGEPYQQIDPISSTSDLRVVDVSGDDSEIVDGFFAQPFDLAKQAPWRALLLHAGPDRHTLLLAVHHIIVDDWSIGILLQDLAECYRSACKGPVDVEPAAPQFADICAHRSVRTDPSTEIAYWRAVLQDSPRTPPLGTDADAAPDGTYADDAYAGGVVPIRIPPDRLNAVRSAAAQFGTTPFVWLLTAFKVALAGLGGHRDLTVGTPLAGRTEPGTDRMVGYFVNPAVLRTTVPDTGTFRDLIQHCARVVIAAHAHGSTPYEHVQDALGRTAHSAPPFHVWFTLLTHTQPRQLADDLSIEPDLLPDRPARFPIALILEPDQNGLIGHLEFARASYLHETITGLADAFSRVLDHSLEAPNVPVSELVEMCQRVKAESDAAREGGFSRAYRGRLAAIRSARQARSAGTRTGP